MKPKITLKILLYTGILSLTSCSGGNDNSSNTGGNDNSSNTGGNENLYPDTSSGKYLEIGENYYKINPDYKDCFAEFYILEDTIPTFQKSIKLYNKEEVRILNLDPNFPHTLFRNPNNYCYHVNISCDKEKQRINNAFVYGLEENCDKYLNNQ